METFMQMLQRNIDEALVAAKEEKANMAPGANPAKARAMSLVITKLEEAELWLTKVW